MELSTVLSGRLYTDSDKITDLLKKYYNMETDPTFEEIPYKLLNLRQAVIKENDLYNEIKNFLKANSSSFIMSVDLAETHASRATITMRKPFFTPYFLSISL